MKCQVHSFRVNNPLRRLVLLALLAGMALPAAASVDPAASAAAVPTTAQAPVSDGAAAEGAGRAKLAWDRVGSPIRWS